MTPVTAENLKDKGFPFLAEVRDTDLREWLVFTETPLFAFLRKHFEKKMLDAGRIALLQRKFVDQPYELAVEQGRAAGYREVLNDFFDNVRKEYKRRVSRHADERAGRA